MKSIASLLFLISPYFLFAQTNYVNESDGFIIHPEVAVGQADFQLASFIENSGYRYSEEITKDGARYFFVTAENFQVAYYFSRDETGGKTDVLIRA